MDQTQAQYKSQLGMQLGYMYNSAEEQSGCTGCGRKQC